jgi:hypothetical protein
VAPQQGDAASLTHATRDNDRKPTITAKHRAPEENLRGISARPLDQSSTDDAPVG